MQKTRSLNAVQKNGLFTVCGINPLTAKDEIFRLGNLSFLWTWILRWVPRSVGTHAPLCNTLFSNKPCPIKI